MIIVCCRALQTVACLIAHMYEIMLKPKLCPVSTASNACSVDFK